MIVRAEGEVWGVVKPGNNVDNTVMIQHSVIFQSQVFSCTILSHSSQSYVLHAATYVLCFLLSLLKKLHNYTCSSHSNYGHYYSINPLSDLILWIIKQKPLFFQRP